MILIKTIAYVSASKILSDWTREALQGSSDITFGGAPHTLITRDTAFAYVSSDDDLETTGQKKSQRDRELSQLQNLPDDVFIDLET